MKRFAAQGLTLIELLVWVVIVGILATWTGLAAIEGIRRGELRQAAQQVAADLQQLRGKAQRYNRIATFAIGSKDQKPQTQGQAYRFGLAGEEATERRLPAGIRLEASQPLEIEYTPPFGELSGVQAHRLVLRHPGAPHLLGSVRVTGVTGKVMVDKVIAK
ncbi:prepilin-type N-terminal cleavage/methylation domain-containing protein [Deinobacterium chartae]|uniref:Prepilin-type N-terminal cleavage/methylation domain-containing protein n=1 Tax=Deinobacterium chartae TaxID=521158 RepID=A0A841HYB8_9DEIO|nr:prepilin-type N-terminal cleavage/methylation domain-containing protein [Deinobacterium chartae]MBB6096912.1 prepilin-type N-terminal cleavage/methylation domain-containing protein [Deinobacterium chartae]